MNCEITMSELEHRLWLAEQNGCRWRRITVACGLTLMALTAIAAKNPGVLVPDLALARRFVAVNERGEPVAFLGHAKNAGLLGIAGSDGGLVFVASQTDHGQGVVATYTPLGRELVKLGVDPTGNGLVSTTPRAYAPPLARRSAPGAGASRSGG